MFPDATVWFHILDMYLPDSTSSSKVRAVYGSPVIVMSKSDLMMTMNFPSVTDVSDNEARTESISSSPSDIFSMFDVELSFLFSFHGLFTCASVNEFCGTNSE